MRKYPPRDRGIITLNKLLAQEKIMISPNRTHERKSFFKYMPASTAEIVLSNSTLRWSSPFKFNDPFDVPRELAFDISPKEIQIALVNKLVNLINNPPEDSRGLDPKVQLVIQALKQNPTEEFKREMIGGLKNEIERNDPAEGGLLAIKQQWQDFLPNFRILCLSEHHDKASMWYHYADKYSGVVIEVICDDELDSAWLAAKKVEYPEKKPQVYTAEGWAELLVKPQGEAVKTILHTCSYTKSPDWSYEDEWRISSFKRENETGLVSDYKVSRHEFGNLYLGPHVQAEMREKLLLLATNYPNMKVFHTQIGLDREFKFIEIQC